MLQSPDNDLVETIVSGVMNRLRTGSTPVAISASRKGSGTTVHSPAPATTVSIPDRVVTGDVLAERLGNAACAQFAAKAVLTPTARDYLRKHGVSWSHASATGPNNAVAVLAILINDASLVKRVLAAEIPNARCELLGCVDDAARLAAAEMARGQYGVTLVFARKAHRAACLANRQSAVRAAAIRDAADVATVGAQLRANTWCLDPTGLGVFELRNTIKAIAAQFPP